MALAEDIEKFRFHPAIDDDRLCQDNQNLLWGRVDRNAECPKDMNAPHVFLLLLKVSYSNNVPEMSPRCSTKTEIHQQLLEFLKGHETANPALFTARRGTRSKRPLIFSRPTT